MTKVIVLGGGVAGMSAAHELLERGFEVEVFERRSVAGGKARSISVPFTATPTNVGSVNVGRIGLSRHYGLPGEHGFRFFPRFYKHVTDTMRRIPVGQGSSVHDNLVGTAKVLFAREGKHGLEIPARFPRSLPDLYSVLDSGLSLFDPDFGISWQDQVFFASRVWQILTSCEERRLGEYEQIGWWDFVQAEGRSKDYQNFFAIGITRSLVASQARRASTKTIGDILVQLLFNIAEPGISSDNVLNGPTGEAWLGPWLEHLERRGGRFHFGSQVLALNVRGGQIRSVTLAQDGLVREVSGDYYVAALPVEAMAPLVTPELLRADAALESIIPLSRNVSWMNGIQFYLTDDVPITPGHVSLVDSPWALTLISQRQFWRDMDLSQYGDGDVRGILSVDISDWETPGLNGKTARECNRQEVRDDVWEQLKRSLNVQGRDPIRDDRLSGWFLDPDVNPATRTNAEPLLVNLVDTWRLRPEAETGIPNLFLASDYIRTYTDLATMEGANEAARRAVNGILRASASSSPPCALWKLHDPALLEPLRQYDRERYRRGAPWDSKLETAVLPAARFAGAAVSQLATPLAALLDAAGFRRRPPAGRSRGTAWLDELADAIQSGAPRTSEVIREVSDLAGSLLSRFSEAMGDAPRTPDTHEANAGRGGSGPSGSGPQPEADGAAQAGQPASGPIRFVQR